MAKLLDASLTLAFWSLLLSGILTVVVGFFAIRSLLHCYWRFQDARDVQAQLAVTQPMPFLALVPGPNFVLLHGKVHAPGLLTSPGGSRCVAYSCGMESKMEPFVLRTEDGAVWVNADSFALAGQTDKEARLQPGDLVSVEGRIAELPADAAIPMSAPDLKWLLTDDIGHPLRVLFANPQVNSRAAMLAQLGRVAAGSIGLLLLFVVLCIGSCVGMAYVLFPGAR